MADDYVETLGAVESKVLVKLRGRSALNMADCSTEAVSNANEPSVGATIPRSIGDWSGRDESHAERGVARLSSRVSLSYARDDGEAAEC